MKFTAGFPRLVFHYFDYFGQPIVTLLGSDYFCGTFRKKSGGGATGVLAPAPLCIRQ